jgi:D-glycero-D-manno-heptose 1,7-bisphosphate phosphatase
MPENRRAVFLDKDGTLIENVPYNIDPSRLVLTFGAIAGLRLLCQAGYLLIVISNQSGVARGYFTEAELVPMMQALQGILSRVGIKLADFYYCPHHPQGVVPAYTADCNCRKPQPGLLYQAADEHSIDLDQSWFIGDILHDVAAGRSAGCRTILLDNGNETEWQLSRNCLPHHTVGNLLEAAKIILAVDSIDSPNHQSSDIPEPIHNQPSTLV